VFLIFCDTPKKKFLKKEKTFQKISKFELKFIDFRVRVQKMRELSRKLFQAEVELS